MKHFTAPNKPAIFAFSFCILAHSLCFAQTRKAKLAAPESVSQYNLSVKILPPEHRAEVSGTWRLPATAKDTNQIDFLLSPKMRNLKARVLEPKLSDASVSLTSEDAGGDTKWTIKTVQPIRAGQSVTLQFSYVSETKPAPQFNISPEGSFASAAGELWYPQTSFGSLATGVLSFSAPAGETVISNGALQSSTERRASGEFVFQVSSPSKFGFASGRYTVLRRAGKIPITLYSLRPRADSQTVLEKSAKALDYLTTLFGEFPYEQFSLVEVDFRSPVAGTSEYGFILADDSQLDKEFNLAYWAHEIGHQWWGVSLKTASGTNHGRMMFSEGLAQFGALLAVEAIEGEKAAEKFRRDGLFSANQSAAGYFQLAAAGTEFPLTTYGPNGQEEILRMHRLANSKGFIVMDMLAREIGRERLTAVLRRFAERNAGQTTAWQTLQKAVEADAGQDIKWFFEQWFERAGAPDYRITWKQTGKRVKGFVAQPSPFYRATVEIEIKGSRRSVIRTIKIDGARTPFNLPAPFKASDVILDPNYKVLRWTPEFRARPNVSTDPKRKRVSVGKQATTE